MTNTCRKGWRRTWRYSSACLLVISANPVFSAFASEPRIEIQVGPSYMDGHDATALFVEALGGQRKLEESPVTWQPVASIGWIDKRSISRYDESRYPTGHDAEILAGGVRLHLGDQQTWYQPLFFGFELAYNHQPTQSLSSHYEFVSTLGWQGKRFSFQLRHISNGGLHDPNRGETMALAGVGFPL